MKAFLGFFVAMIVAAAYAEGETFAAKMAGVFGAKAKVVFYVVDDAGTPVEGARVGAGFYMNKRKGNPHDFGFTDKHGLCALEEKTVNEVTYTVSKEGYYETNGRLWFGGGVGKPAIVKWGKWQPYGATNNVILKPIKNPVKMIYHEFEKNVETNKVVGFDLNIGDCVHPYGKGKVADFSFVYTFRKIDTWNMHGTLTLLFTNELDGAYQKKKTVGSLYPSDYHASTNQIYQRKIVYEFNSTTNVNDLLSKDDYLVMRTRTKVNEKNELIAAHYSKIYGPLRLLQVGFALVSYWNPICNDTNLESNYKFYP